VSSLVIDDSGPLDTRNKTTVLILKTNAGSYATGKGGITLFLLSVYQKKKNNNNNNKNENENFGIEFAHTPCDAVPRVHYSRELGSLRESPRRITRKSVEHHYTKS